MKDAYPEDDSNIVKACVNGDLSAWSRLTQKYERLIYAAIVSCLGKYGFTLPPQDIEDIRQNVLTAVWKGGKLKNIKNRKNISYWLAIVSGNKAMEYMRAKRSQDIPKPIGLTYESGEELKEPAYAFGADASDDLTRKEILEKIEDAIDALPYKEKLMIKLNIYHDKKFREIAEILNVPKGTVSSYVKRAKEELMRKLKDF
jgi:RNA polymerase sigma-70 factor (ECF subfamily)